MWSATGGSVASTTGRARSDSTWHSPSPGTRDGQSLGRPPPILALHRQPVPAGVRHGEGPRGSVFVGDDPLQVGGHAGGLVRGTGDGLLRLGGGHALLLD